MTFQIGGHEGVGVVTVPCLISFARECRNKSAFSASGESCCASLSILCLVRRSEMCAKCLTEEAGSTKHLKCLPRPQTRGTSVCTFYKSTDQPPASLKPSFGRKTTAWLRIFGANFSRPNLLSSSIGICCTCAQWTRILQANNTTGFSTGRKRTKTRCLASCVEIGTD